MAAEAGSLIKKIDTQKPFKISDEFLKNLLQEHAEDIFNKETLSTILRHNLPDLGQEDPEEVNETVNLFGESCLEKLKTYLEEAIIPKFKNLLETKDFEYSKDSLLLTTSKDIKEKYADRKLEILEHYYKLTKNRNDELQKTYKEKLDELSLSEENLQQDLVRKNEQINVIMNENKDYEMIINFEQNNSIINNNS